ncbi:LIM and senescent cell antigen-like-containing domain protein 2 [Coemansia spiralis]|uniref:LIM and senescent cell antigen-like-containing domain protein 2 n=1 Tax=Coemansia spiralis TaxID=417178 RepID=A0A9W8L5P6_9FUNG|nr:LIM and senescent cell antigen-like-containing domain protein 2 [Coemansia spiralis]
MYCRRCGEIVVNEATCKKCGGRAVESTTGAGAMNTTNSERKDPWTSKYLQRRLNPANVSKGAGAGAGAGVAVPRPISTALSSSFDSGLGHEFDYARAPQRPVTGSPGGRAGADADALGLPRPRGIRDGGGRPSSMHAGAVLDPALSAVQRTVLDPARGLKSKWSQYFTSTAAPDAEPPSRARSESLSAPAQALRPAHSSSAADVAAPRVAGSAAAVRAAGSPLAERSRSATLPDNGARPCTTCGRALRAEEQRQFATQPGAVFCTGCYHASYSRGACAGCGKVVLTHGRPWAQYGGRVWHKLCIRCRACSRLLVAPLVGADGEPSCEPCLAAKGARAEPPSPASGRSSAALVSEAALAAAQAQAQASLPTPALSDAGADARFSALRIVSPAEAAAHQGLPALRIMSPVEVAAHQGLPPPRAIVDPAAPPPDAPQPAPRPSPAPSRTASPRSVSFRVDEPEEPRSLADYVLSRASSTPRAKPGALPSVADTIKKLAAAGSGSVAARAAPVLPELQDLVRTHQRDAPTDPTVPALDRHSRILKSRPRNANRRQPTAASPEPAPAPVAPNACARCARAIEDTWFRLSDGRQVHVECFSCQGCQRLIDDGVYVLDAGVEFHPQCVPPAPPPVVSVSPVPSEHSSQGRVRGPRAPRRDEACDRCHAVLAGPRFQLTNGKQYHPECFACAGCAQRFDEGSYVCFEGNEYHHHCVDALNHPPPAPEHPEDEALACAECKKPIEGVFLRHNEAVFHPACFCCHDCHRPITPGMPFGEIDARPCCESCLERRAVQPIQHPHIPMPQPSNAWPTAPQPAHRQQQYYPAKTGY